MNELIEQLKRIADAQEKANELYVDSLERQRARNAAKDESDKSEDSFLVRLHNIVEREEKVAEREKLAEERINVANELMLDWVNRK